jgi:hypothetical protein
MKEIDNDRKQAKIKKIIEIIWEKNLFSKNKNTL